MDFNEIVDAVNNIEQDIFESTGGVEYLNLTAKSNGFMTIVDFIGVTIWDSEEDCRLYLDESDENKREDIEICFRRRIKEEMGKIASIKI